ncbi:NADPH-dependent FMN reductase [Pedococcus sp. 5OH_020]|uniref:NADPH-dependent FMN reductase n=1 Tax=Pedococcus sp. 5OH_020 TaxID=2989814 RepID=UPI0022E9DE93|nr:NAD(P)H-dependent oxidoreductase [Pedococcus sp. 5OH_020]
MAISGSLRRASFNTRLLDEAAKLAPEVFQFDLYESLGNLPHFNEDHEMPAPPAVDDLRRRLRAADGLLIATPEYNASVPGALKNAIDWLSRPSEGETLPLKGKPVAIIGASMSPLGTVRAQLSLRQILHKLDAAVVRQPEFILGSAHAQLEERSSGLDFATAEVLRLVLEQLRTLIDRASHVSVT